MKHSFCDDWEFTHTGPKPLARGCRYQNSKPSACPIPAGRCRCTMPLRPITRWSAATGSGSGCRRCRLRPGLFLRFDGAAHQAVVRVNGRVAGQHRGGYTGFAVEITDLVDREGENLLTVQLDTREDPAFHPLACHRLPDLRRAVPGGLAGSYGREPPDRPVRLHTHPA